MTTSQMKKSIMDFSVKQNCHLSPLYSLLKLVPADGTAVPEVLPGQFVQVAIDDSKTTFLRRPISICNVDRADNTLWLLVRRAGEGTAALIAAAEGRIVNLVLPLGNGFSVSEPGQKVLLVGGGVGVAPLLMLGRSLAESGCRPSFLLGARSASDLLLLDEFEELGEVHIATDDGSRGEKGVVTLHSAIAPGNAWDKIYCCGPAPMMKAVAKAATALGAECEVSLENMMACGLGACLCCVEKTVRGNVCVCTEGPVFNIKELTWEV